MTSVHQLFAVAAVALVPMAPKLPSLPRAARISMAGQWVDGNSDWVYPENLGDALQELADPSPEVEPLAIVQLQLAQARRGPTPRATPDDFGVHKFLCERAEGRERGNVEL